MIIKIGRCAALRQRRDAGACIEAAADIDEEVARLE